MRRQILRLGQSDERRLSAFLEDTAEPGRAGRIDFDRLPFDLGDETLRMRRLLTVGAKLVRRVTEGPSSCISEEVVELFPIVRLDWDVMI